MPPIAFDDQDIVRIQELTDTDERAPELLEKLPAAQRDAVRARVVDELDYEALALKLGALRAARSPARQPRTTQPTHPDDGAAINDYLTQLQLCTQPWPEAPVQEPFAIGTRTFTVFPFCWVTAASIPSSALETSERRARSISAEATLRGCLSPTGRAEFVGASYSSGDATIAASRCSSRFAIYEQVCGNHDPVTSRRTP